MACKFLFGPKDAQQSNMAYARPSLRRRRRLQIAGSNDSELNRAFLAEEKALQNSSTYPE